MRTQINPWSCYIIEIKDMPDMNPPDKNSQIKKISNKDFSLEQKQV